MTSGSEWQAQVGRSWAAMYPLTDRSFAGLTQHLLERITLRTARTVLDIGCGAGELTLALARAWPHTECVGLDISDDLTLAARARGAALENARFVVGDAAQWSDPQFSPDLLVSRHGVMFFTDPRAAFSHLRQISAPGAELIFSCFRSPRENPWALGLAGLLDRPAPGDPYAPGPFAFADQHHVQTILSGAGWRDIEFEPVDFAYIAGKGSDPVADALAFFSRIGPAAAAFRELDAATRAAAEARISTWLTAHRSGDLVVFGAAAWFVSARRD